MILLRSFKKTLKNFFKNSLYMQANLMMAYERFKRGRNIFSKFIHQPETKILIRKLERILIKWYGRNVSLLFDQTYLYWALWYPVRYKMQTNERCCCCCYIIPYNCLANVVCLLAKRSDTKSNLKLGGFWSQLQASYVSSHTEKLWYNESVYLWMTIHIYISVTCADNTEILSSRL